LTRANLAAAGVTLFGGAVVMLLVGRTELAVVLIVCGASAMVVSAGLPPR